MKIAALALILLFLVPLAPASQGGGAPSGYSTSDTDSFTVNGAGGGTVGTLPATVQTFDNLRIITRSDGRQAVVYGALMQAPAAQAPDLTVSWKCKAGTITRNYYKKDYGGDSHAMDVNAAHEIEQMQAIVLFKPID